MFEIFSVVLDYFIAGAVAITFIEAYLKVNKIWKRRHEREVAASQSFLGLSLSFITSTVWVLKYSIDNNIEGATEYSIFLIEAFIFILIGTGLFVKGNRELGIWHLIKQSLKMERKEANYLLKKLFKPQNADEIIEMLYRLAVIDGEFDAKEKELIEAFAKEWNIPIDFAKLDKELPGSKEAAYIRLRDEVAEYLDSQPSTDQASCFKDMMSAIVNADDKITEEEALISDELITMIENYIKQDDAHLQFHVIVVPQEPHHDSLITTLEPGSKRLRTPGGYVYSVGSYYSKKYAEMICKRYRQNNLLTLTLEPEEFAETIR